ncbi:MAG: CoA-binding protein, partial [Trebonia sp.]
MGEVRAGAEVIPSHGGDPRRDDNRPRDSDARREGVHAMLEARSVALVGASPSPASLSYRALCELERSPVPPVVHLVNPRRAGQENRGRTVLATLDEVPGPVDLVLLAVGDDHLEETIAAAARRGDRGAVVFSNAVSKPDERLQLRDRIAQIASDAGMALCGAACMGFVSRTTRAIGYLEPAPLPAGPIALVTHSGSVFSALLRAERPFSWSIAVSSG